MTDLQCTISERLYPVSSPYMTLVMTCQDSLGIPLFLLMQPFKLSQIFMIKSALVCIITCIYHPCLFLTLYFLLVNSPLFVESPDGW